MTNTPFAPSSQEIKEMAEMKELRELWGAENAKEMEEILSDIYVAKFEFMNESPGYVGDLLIVVQPGVLGAEYPVTRLIRSKEGRLKLLE